MPQPAKTRREVLEEFLAGNPNDAFARYGLAMECATAGDSAAAIAHYEQLLKSHPDYVAGYLQFGLLLVQLEKKDDARRILTQGVAAARKAGNSHAQSEMESVLSSLQP